jgi:CoA:oxalate CoA-transferase
LAKISDILIENFKPGDAEKLNIGYNNIKEINNRIIYGSISGYGN